jgi:hypothetical protein
LAVVGPHVRNEVERDGLLLFLMFDFNRFVVIELYFNDSGSVSFLLVLLLNLVEHSISNKSSFSAAAAVVVVVVIVTRPINYHLFFLSRFVPLNVSNRRRRK